MAKHRTEIIELFRVGRSPYQIHVDTGISIGEVYHYVEQDELARKKHKAQLKKNRELEKTNISNSDV